MVRFKLIKIEDGFYTYEIYPEGHMDDIGVLIFNPETHEVKEKKYPKAGVVYLNKAIGGLMDETGTYKKSGMVAWY